MLDFTENRIPLEELKAIYSIAMNDTASDAMDPLEVLQERVMEKTIEHIAEYLEQCAKFVKGLPVEYDQKIEDTIENMCSQLVEVATNNGLLIGFGDEVDGHGLSLV
jgi:hypothetical protein